MKILICIDDTDNMESIGTGELLELMGKEMKKQGLGEAGFISRHQLYVHKDIPYTSHNSSMCFEMEILPENFEEVRGSAVAFLEENAAEGSDPGLCIIMREFLSEEMKEALITYGKTAKDTILVKPSAYELAESMKDVVYLSEHGGTGGGVIGSLAGCGLRLFGNDGKMKGKIYPENEGVTVKVETILKGYPFDAVYTFEGEPLPMDTKVRLGETLKAVIRDHRCVLPVKALEKKDGEPQVYRTCEKKELKGL